MMLGSSLLACRPLHSLMTISWRAGRLAVGRTDGLNPLGKEHEPTSGPTVGWSLFFAGGQSFHEGLKIRPAPQRVQVGVGAEGLQVLRGVEMTHLPGLDQQVHCPGS